MEILAITYRLEFKHDHEYDIVFAVRSVCVSVCVPNICMGFIIFFQVLVFCLFVSHHFEKIKFAISLLIVKSQKES